MEHQLNLIGLLLVAAITVPTITALPEERFEVNFESGADGACTVFTQLTGEGRPYMFRSCHELGPRVHTFIDDWDLVIRSNDDWDVFTEIYYTTAGNTVETVETNHLKVHR